MGGMNSYGPKSMRYATGEPTLGHGSFGGTHKAPDRAPDTDGKAGNRKMDLDKPPIVRGFHNYFPHASVAVAWVSEYGDRKYVPAEAPPEAHFTAGWQKVPNGEARYADADGRHRAKIGIEGDYDSESDLAHLSHKAWCAMAELELAIRSKRIEMRRGNDIVNGVPQPGTFRKVSL